MKRPKPPCQYCTNRGAACHANCDKWAEYEKARAAFYKAKDKAATNDRIIRGIECDRIEAIKKQRGRCKK